MSSNQGNIDELLADYLRRKDAGEPGLTPQSFAAAHPEVEDLLSILSVEEQVEEMAGPVEETINFEQTFSSAHRMHESELIPGDQLGNYLLLRELGRGGMGAVFVARQENPERDVALKTILAGTKASIDDIERFYTEARIAGSLGHPNIVTIYEAGESDGHHYMTMEFVKGFSLAEYVKHNKLSEKEIAELIAQTAEGIHAAHEAGIVHRDIKPSNILVDDSGKPIITDFGLAKLDSDDRDLTKSNCTLGTPSYMPPEQAIGKLEQITPQSDIYSLGAVMYLLLTGRPPHTGETSMEIIMRVLQHPIKRPRELNPTISRELDAIIWKCLETDVEHRYESAQDLADDLRRLVRGEPVHAALSFSRRVSYWCSNMPGLGHFIGTRRADPKWHHWMAWVGIALLALSPFIYSGIYRYRFANTIPRFITIYTGPRGNSFDRTGQTLGKLLKEQLGDKFKITVKTTEGSEQNVKKLHAEELTLSHGALALVQAELFRPRYEDELAIVPILPLFNEGVYIVVRADSEIDRIEKIKNPVALGVEGSGTFVTATNLTRRLKFANPKIEIDVQDKRNHVDVTYLNADTSYQAAVVVVSSSHVVLQGMLESGNFKLLNLSKDEIDELAEERLYNTTIERQDSRIVASAGIEEYSTVYTTTYLTMRTNRHPQLMKKISAILQDNRQAFQSPQIFDRQKMLRISDYLPEIDQEAHKELLKPITQKQ